MGEKLRKDVDARYKWRLEDIYKGEDVWKKEFKEAEAQVREVVGFKGKLNTKKNVMDFFKLSDKFSYLSVRLYCYAKMRFDEDASVTHYQELTDKAQLLGVKWSEATSFVEPELSLLADSKLKEWAKDKNFANYDQILLDVIRNKKHTLSESEEKILSSMGSFSSGFNNIFDMLDSLELDFADVTMPDGSRQKLTHATYGLILDTAKEQSVRQEAFEGYYAAYKKVLNSISLMLSNHTKMQWFYAKARKFKSSMDSALHYTNVPRKIYDNLLEAVEENTPLMHRYISLRKKLLGVKKLNFWDLRISMIEDTNIGLPYDEAYDLTVDACKPLGEDFVRVLREAKTSGWIDVYENKGKTSGAYKWGPYGTHPFVLLNYEPTATELFTIAHEMGHAMHGFYSYKTQPISKAYYKIFVAEVASTVHEVLLLRYLINNPYRVASCDKCRGSGHEAGTTNCELGKACPRLKVKKFLLNYLLDMFRSTLFRQTKFAQFEAAIHEVVEKDKPLSVQTMNEIYLGLTKKYYGGDIEYNEQIAYEWARIPHMYYNFYVYQYATGLTSAMAIASAILRGEKDAVKNYIKFLSAGCSKPPTDILKIAGVDLSKKDAFKSAFKVFEETLEELEALTT
ncbi:MAG: oligoendopeptidase F family protein [Firmicutes bacterium]|nr:oligoendopeptidase F family protein [Bacillota bacterium]